MSDFRQDFLKFALAQNVLKFGEFTTKAGRQSPYFFNDGQLRDGASTLQLARFYARAVLESSIKFDMLFGPAYKGIVLAAAAAMMLAEQGVNVPFAYNRKEAKDHGEGGVLVGAPLQGRVLIIDDVISAGTSVRESVNLIQAQGATPAAVAIALDRMEKGTGDLSAVRPARRRHRHPRLFVHPAEKQRRIRPILRTGANLPPTLRRINNRRPSENRFSDGLTPNT